MPDDSPPEHEDPRPGSAPLPDAAPSPAPSSKPRGYWQPPAIEQLQEQIPQYKILGLLGRGGMGAVYQGWQTSLERYVAIKILPPNIDEDDAQFTERFKQEARTMAKFQHPGIVSIYNAGETPSGLLYIVMEFIEGTDVAQMVKSQGRLPPGHALAITAHVCDALQYAHSHGVIHRDIKPANVLMNMEGSVKVADFGLAKAAGPSQGGLTVGNVAMGTPHYLAPEALITGLDIDGRADLYALGVMLYEMLTGQVPHGRFEMPSVKTGGETDVRFDHIISRAMQQDREKRYQAAHEIRQDLDVILTTPKLEARREGSSAIPKHQLAVMRQGLAHKKPVARRPGELAGGQAGQMVTYVPKKKSNLPALAAGIVLTAGALFAWQKFKSQPQPAAAASSPVVSTPSQPAAAASSPASGTRQPVVGPAASTSQPGDVFSFGGHRYQLVRERIEWSAAEAKAESMGGHLATITTQEEHEWVTGQFASALADGPVGTSMWLGGVQDRQDAPWRWITGEPFTDIGWNRNEPNYKPLQFPTHIALTLSSDGTFGWNDVPLGNAGAYGIDGSVGFLVELDDNLKPTDAPMPIAATTNDGSGKTAAFNPTGRPMSAETAQLVENSIRKPEDTILAMKVAALQVWFGNDTDYEATRQRMLAWVVNNISAENANRVAKIACLRPVTEASQREAVLTIARKCLELGQGKPLAPWYQISLGMAEYRNGRYSAADQALAAAAQTASSAGKVAQPRIEGTANFYRAMSLFKQGRPTEARALFAATEGAMKPLPADDQNTLAGTSISHDDLILWLAGKETKALLAAPERLAQIETQFNEAYERDVTKGPAAAAIADLDKKYLAALDRALADATKAGMPGDAIALRAEKQRLIEKAPLPAADPGNITSGLKKLRDTYRTALAPLVKKRDAAAEAVNARYDQALAAYQTELTQKNEISDALAVKGLREALEKQRRPASPEPMISAAPQPALAPPPPKLAETKPSGDDPKKVAPPAVLPPEMLNEPVPKPFTPQQAVQWALSLGGSAKIKKGSVESEVLSVANIPRGSFTVIGLMLGEKQPLHVVSLAALAGLVDLRELTLDNNLVTDAGLAFLPKLPKLDELSLKGCGLSDAGLAHLAKQSTLTRLGLSKNPINGSGLRQIAGLQALHTLEIGTAPLADENIPALASFASLATLDFSGDKPLTCTDLSSLAGIKALKRIALGWAATDQAVQSLGTLAQLEALDLNHAPITDSALDRIGSMKGLRDLNLYGSQNLTDLGFAKLQALKGLQKLNVGHTRLTDSQFVTLGAKLLELTELNISADGVSDAGLAGLANLRKIGRLSIHARMCTDQGLGYVRRLANLRLINIEKMETLNQSRMDTLRRGLPNVDFGKR